MFWNDKICIIMENELKLRDNIELYTDSNGIQYTKQRLFESIYYFNSNMFCGLGGYPGSWIAAVEKMGEWYETNIHTYQHSKSASDPIKGKKMYVCPLLTRTNNNVADDCSGFVKACIQYFGIKEIDHIWVTTSAMQPGSEFDKVLRNNGFQYMIYSKEVRKVGDIMCGGPGSHTEIYAGTFGGKHRSYSWGNIHDGISTRKQKFPQGMPCATYEMNYKHIWRYNG